MTDDNQVEMMRWTYGLVPLAAGADKFTNLLCDWTKYLSPTARDLLPVSPETFMRVVGVVEMAAGALVLAPKTSRLGAVVVGGWLGAIAANLVMDRRYDIAVRDLALGIGALSLAHFLGKRAARKADVQPGAETVRRPKPSDTYVH